MPEPSLCDSCKHAYCLLGGYASIGAVSVPQRYCGEFKISLHFKGMEECYGYISNVGNKSD